MSETELTASVLKKKNRNTQEVKRTLFNWTKQDKTCKFSRKSSFSSYVQHKNRQKKKSSIYLVSVGCGRLAEGKGHETDLVEVFFFVRVSGRVLCIH